jgi:hypothetical protein
MIRPISDITRASRQPAGFIPHQMRVLYRFAPSLLRSLMAETPENTPLGLASGSETQGNSYDASSPAVAEDKEPQGLPTASPPRESWENIFSANPRQLYRLQILPLIVIWIFLVVGSAFRSSSQQGAVLNSDLNRKTIQGKFSDFNVRTQGRQTKFANSCMADGHERTPQEVVR